MSRHRKTKTKGLRNEHVNPAFKLLIYDSEYRQIQAWTAKFPNCETGGDLFGLWLDERTAVVQLVLGPGRHCRRTGASFYQDVEYLERVGNQLTTKEGLCHIGEWHSHHTLGLTRPSGGDENTVWSNMHRYGIHRFCLFIATIAYPSWTYKGVIERKINVNGYLFEINRQDNSQHLLEPREFEYIPENSPFRKSNEEEIRNGAESLNSAKELSIEKDRSHSPSIERSSLDNQVSDSSEVDSKKSQAKRSKGNKSYELVAVVEDDEQPADISSDSSESWWEWLCERLHHYLCYLCLGK
ncbi:hypothetical protein QZH41_002255 [Actinostola sp. cb2023]|nr:hypothetical protein QZH41_002255 [Actinostola sp. cb2023]